MDLRRDETHAWLAASSTTGGYEPHIRAVLDWVAQPGDIAYDVGGNLGWHAATLSKIVGPSGQVHTFEPQTTLLPLLHLTAEALENVRVHGYGLSTKSAVAELYIPADHHMASLADWTKGRVDQAANTVSCQLRSLDELVNGNELPRPDCMKLDVEGAELDVLMGGRAVLNSKEAPVILFEAGTLQAAAFGRRKRAAFDFLRTLDRPKWTFYTLSDGRVTPSHPEEAGEKELVMYIAVPEARFGRVPGHLT